MASIKRKQYKNTYKIPRSLKDSIKQSLNKIVKRRERKIRAEEVCTSLLLFVPLSSKTNLTLSSTA